MGSPYIKRIVDSGTIVNIFSETTTLNCWNSRWNFKFSRQMTAEGFEFFSCLLQSYHFCGVTLGCWLVSLWLKIRQNFFLQFQNLFIQLISSHIQTKFCNLVTFTRENCYEEKFNYIDRVHQIKLNFFQRFINGMEIRKLVRAALCRWLSDHYLFCCYFSPRRG